MLPKEVGFIVDYEPNPLLDTVFRDLEGYENVYCVTEPFDGNLLRRLLKKRKIQRLTGGHLNFLVNKHFALYHKLTEIVNRYEQIVVLFTNYSFCNTQMPAGALKTYKKKWPNLQYVLYYYDSIRQGASICANYVREKDVFDACYTFDATDAQLYGLNHWWSLYSRIENIVHTLPTNDLYFCGQGFNRIPLIASLLEHALEQHVSFDMHIANIEEGVHSDALQYPNVHVLEKGTRISYPESLAHCVQARCILEISNPRHNGLTLRPFEAVCYNRKLLTNNKAIFSFPYYDSRYMHYFEKVEDIDWNWVKEDIEVNYHYNGEFSPIHLLEDIVKNTGEMRNGA